MHQSNLRAENLKTFVTSCEVQAAICPEIDAAIDAIRSEISHLDLKVITLRWQVPGTSVDRLIDEAVEALARLSLALWPNWGGPSTAIDDQGDAVTARQILPQWREVAERYCRSGQLPIPREYPAASEVSQLSLTLAPDGVTIIMVVDQVTGESAISVRAAAEWLAANCAAAVLVLLPPQSGLDDILRRNFSLIDLFGCASSIARAADSAPPGETRYPTADLFPILGAPHPLSLGERKLAERLLADPELAPLFAFNRRIAGRHGNDYIVDLVWQEGALVVEVDSFQAHGSRFAFAQDRHRDYELMAANYRVLRITHDEAARDTDSAVEKIRVLVRLIRRSYKQE